MTTTLPAQDAPAVVPAQGSSPAPTLADLLAFARATAADPEVLAQLQLHPTERTWVRLDGPLGSEGWLIGWPPGTETGWHDHGGSSGAFVTAQGELSELSLSFALPTVGWRTLELEQGVDRQRLLGAGRGRSFGPHHVHQVLNPSAETHAVSVHCYYPPLPNQRKYLRAEQTLTLRQIETPEQW